MFVSIYTNRYNILFNIILLAFTTSNYNRANDMAVRVCGNRLLERLTSPLPKSQV